MQRPSLAIEKATLQQLLRTSWKLPLAVLLCGVALLAVHHIFDVTELREAAQEAMQGRPATLSPEQIEAIEKGQRISPVVGVLDAFFLVGPVLVGLLMPGGLVANEQRSGAIMLWAQHPMPLSRFYMRRYLAIQIATLAALALIGGAVVLDLALPSDAVIEASGYADFCIAGVLACAISFAVTALGFRRASFLAFAYYVGSHMTQSPQLHDAFASISDVLPFVIFPLPYTIRDFTGGFASDVPWNWGATGVIAYHFALWTGVAWLGLRRLERTPLRL